MQQIGLCIPVNMFNSYFLLSSPERDVLWVSVNIMKEEDLFPPRSCVITALAGEDQHSFFSSKTPLRPGREGQDSLSKLIGPHCTFSCSSFHHLSMQQ